MTTEQERMLEKVRELQRKASSTWMDYWLQYSNIDTWQFWINALMLVVPLIVIFFLIDRKRIFLIGFFGYNVHVWFTYIDLTGVRLDLWKYPYQIVPFLPVSFALDVSLTPVAFMLAYQWAVKHNKNIYLCLIGVSALFAFILKPLMTALHLFQFYKWINFFYLFIAYIIVMLLSKWITDMFLWLEKHPRQPST